MKKTLSLSALTFVVLLFGSCTHRLTDFTVISTKNVPLGIESTQIKKADTRVKGVDKSHVVLFLPIGSPNMKEAIDKAIHQYPGCVGLADGVVKSSFWDAILYGQSSYIVEGTPLYIDDSDNYNDNGYGNGNGNGNGNYRNDMNQRGAYYQSNDNANAPAHIFNTQSQNDENASILFFHQVKRGETLPSIAKEYGVKVNDLIKWNKLGSSVVSEREKLKIYIEE